jgi:hypothetical protein
MEAVAVLDRCDAVALDCAGEDRERAPVGLDRGGVGAVDGLDVVAVDLDRPPAERAVATSTHGRRGVGCPSSRLSSRR